VQRHPALVGLIPVLEDINTLPGAEIGLAICDGNREMHRGQRGFDVGWHIVRPLEAVLIKSVIFRHQLLEKALKIHAYRWIRILLNDQGRRGVVQKDSQEARSDILGFDKAPDVSGYLVKPLPFGLDDQRMPCLQLPDSRVKRFLLMIPSCSVAILTQFYWRIRLFRKRLDTLHKGNP